MADLRIVDAPVLLQESITDDVKMPTGGLGNYAIRLGDLVWYVVTKEQLANKSYVDLSSKGVKDSLDVHITDKANPHNVTKAQVGLGNVDNTADIDKPVSNAVNSAIITATTDMATKTYVNQKDDLKADKATTLSGYGINDAYTKDETYNRDEIDGRDGDLTTLKTNDKNNLVKAINEIHDNTNGVVDLYGKNVGFGAGTNGWDSNLVIYGKATQKQINDGLDSIAQLLSIQEPRSGMRVYVKSYYTGLNKGGGLFVYDSSKSTVNDGGAILNGWVRLDVETVTPFMFGARGDNSTDDYDSFFKCFNAYPERSALNIYIPTGTYKISKTLFITRPHKISGPSGMEAYKSILDFSGATVEGLPDIKGALWVYHSNTKAVIPLPTGQVGSYGGGARIDGITVTDSPADGIVLNAPAKASNCHSRRNGGDGVRVYGGTKGGNANHSLIIHTKCSGNGGSGIRVEGSDGNSFTIIGCMVSGNAHYGINDASLLGGVVIGCESDSNGLAAYNQRGGPADNSGLGATPSRTVWLGNYAEGNQPRNYSLNARSTVIGATGATPEPGNGFLASSVAGMYSKRTLVVAESEQTAYDETSNFAKLGAGLLRMGWEGVSEKFRVTYSLNYINIGTDVGSGNQISLRVGSNFNNAITTNRPYLPNGFALAANHAQTTSSAEPTTGSYEKGHVVWNTNPVAGGFVGWICVTAGSPGVWKTFGAISA